MFSVSAMSCKQEFQLSTRNTPVSVLQGLHSDISIWSHIDN